MSTWRRDIENAPDQCVHNVVGRYPHATSGFPRYAFKDGDRWIEKSRHGREDIIVWAWRLRDEWPSEHGAEGGGTYLGGLRDGMLRCARIVEEFAPGGIRYEHGHDDASMRAAIREHIMNAMRNVPS